MYQCPNCGRATFSIWRKAAASYPSPCECTNCGASVASKALPQLPFVLAGFAVVIALIAILSRTNLDWSAYALSVALLIATLLAAVHWTPLTVVTPKSTRLGRILVAIGWIIVLVMLVLLGTRGP